MEEKQIIDAMLGVVNTALANVHTLTIAKISSVGEKTISCLPVINRVVNGEDVRLPEFIDVPPIFLRGGASYTAHPIAVNDYCLLMVTERCYDRWWIGSDFRRPLEARMFDYSDGFALCGIGNLAGLITIPEVITQIGDTYQAGNYEHLGNVEQTGDYTQAGNYDLTGDIAQEGNTAQTGNITLTGGLEVSGNTDSGTYSAGGTSGASGTFDSDDGKVITVTEGLITAIV